MAHLFFEAASPIIKMYYRRDVTASPHKVTSPQSHGGFAIRNAHADDSDYKFEQTITPDCKSGVTMENGVTRLK